MNKKTTVSGFIVTELLSLSSVLNYLFQRIRLSLLIPGLFAISIDFSPMFLSSSTACPLNSFVNVFFLTFKPPNWILYFGLI